MKPRAKPKKVVPERKLSADAKFALSRRKQVDLTRRNLSNIPADRGANEKESKTQGSE